MQDKLCTHDAPSEAHYVPTGPACTEGGEVHSDSQQPLHCPASELAVQCTEEAQHLPRCTLREYDEPIAEQPHWSTHTVRAGDWFKTNLSQDPTVHLVWTVLHSAVWSSSQDSYSKGYGHDQRLLTPLGAGSVRRH